MFLVMFFFQYEIIKVLECFGSQSRIFLMLFFIVIVIFRIKERVNKKTRYFTKKHNKKIKYFKLNLSQINFLGNGGGREY